jgi:hypothetical protein
MDQNQKEDPNQSVTIQSILGHRENGVRHHRWSVKVWA